MSCEANPHIRPQGRWPASAVRTHQYGSMSHVEFCTRESNQKPTSTLRKNRIFTPMIGLSDVHSQSCRPRSNLSHDPNCPTSHADGSGATRMSRRPKACFPVVGSSSSEVGSIDLALDSPLPSTCGARTRAGDFPRGDPGPRLCPGIPDLSCLRIPGYRYRYVQGFKSKKWGETWEESGSEVSLNQTQRFPSD